MSHWKYFSSLEYLIKIISFINSPNFFFAAKRWLHCQNSINKYFISTASRIVSVSFHLLILLVARQQHGLLVIILADCCYLLRKLSRRSESGRLGDIWIRFNAERLLLRLLFVCRYVLRLLIWVFGIVWWHTNAAWILTAFIVIIITMKWKSVKFAFV